MDDGLKEIIVLLITSGTTVLLTWLKMRQPAAPSHPPEPPVAPPLPPEGGGL